MEPNEGYDSLEHELQHLLDIADKLSKRCGFGKWEFECSQSERNSRELYKHYMDRVNEIEVELGL